MCSPGMLYTSGGMPAAAVLFALCVLFVLLSLPSGCACVARRAASAVCATSLTLLRCTRPHIRHQCSTCTSCVEPILAALMTGNSAPTAANHCARACTGDSCAPDA
jgi:hypothetical protein